MFGAPLNVWDIEVVREQGGTPQEYYLLSLEIDNDPELLARLKPKFQENIGSINRLILMEQRRPSPTDVSHQRVYTLEKPWLYSLQMHYIHSRYRADAWKKPALGVAFRKTAVHTAYIQDLRGMDY